jgi:pimeloyl-ACP methyl ester carboxylesterase
MGMALRLLQRLLELVRTKLSRLYSSLQTFHQTGKRVRGWKEFGITLSKIPLFHQLLNPALVTASSELVSLPDEIRGVEGEFSTIGMPVTVVSGTRDLVASVTNIEYITSYFTGAKVDTKQINTGHLIPQNHSAVIKDAILSQSALIQ